jgi:hypothetical protein
MQFAADHSETLEVFSTANRWYKRHLYVSQSVVYEMATVQERSRCVGWLIETGHFQEHRSAEKVQCLGLHVHQT